MCLSPSPYRHDSQQLPPDQHMGISAQLTQHATHKVQEVFMSQPGHSGQSIGSRTMHQTPRRAWKM